MTILRHLALLAILALACIFAGFQVAFAADAASTALDISPILNQVVVPFVVAALGILGAWVLLQLRTRLGLSANDALASTLETAMQNGLALAQQRIAGAGPITVDLHSQIAAQAAAYVQTQAPGVLKQLGVTPDQLAQKLMARIALNTTPPEQSVAVPTPAQPGA